MSRFEGFYWVAKTAGYASAARAMPYPISQPGVYQQVKRLEAELELGESLFVRQGRGTMLLTPTGQALYDFVAPFFEGLPAALRTAQSVSRGGLLRVQAAHQVVLELLPAWTAELLRLRPEARVEVVEDAAVDAERLRRGETDVIIDYVPDVLPADIAVRQVAMNHSFVVVPSPWALDREDVTDGLEELTFVAYSRELPQHQLQQLALAHFGVRPVSVVHVERAETIIAMVAAGVGFSFVPSLYDDGPRTEGVTSLHLDLDGAQFPVSALWRATGPTHPLVELLVDIAVLT